MKNLIYAAGGAVILAGCAGISKEECVYADWRAVGFEDGAAGRQISAVTPLRAACAKKAGVTVDMAAYREGRDEGLGLYCAPSNGYAVGARGGYNTGVCVDHGEADFAAAFDVGRQLFILENDLAVIENRIRQAQYDIRGLEHAMAETEVSLVSPGLAAGERIRLVAVLKQQHQDKKDLEIAVARMHRDKRRAQADLDDFRHDLSLAGGWRGVVQATDARY